MGVALTALKGATDEERLASIGDQNESTVSTTVTRLLDDGWVWDAKAKKLVNPANPSETPLDGVGRIQKQKQEQPPAPQAAPVEPIVEVPETFDQLRERMRASLAAQPIEQEPELEQPQPEPPVVEETAPPVEPIPAVEETIAAPLPEEQFPKVENVVAPAGETEVGLGMEEKLLKPYAVIAVPDLEQLPDIDWGRRRAYLEGKLRNNAAEEQELLQTPKNQWENYHYNTKARINEVNASLRAAIQDMQLARPDLEKSFAKSQGGSEAGGVQRATSEARATAADERGAGGKLQQQPATLQRDGEQSEAAETSRQSQTGKSPSIGGIGGDVVATARISVESLKQQARGIIEAQFGEGETGVKDALSVFDGRASAKDFIADDIPALTDSVLEEWRVPKAQRDAIYKQLTKQIEAYYAQEEAPPPQAQPVAEKPAAETPGNSIAEQLRAATSREEAERIVGKATHDELKAAAKAMNYTPSGTKKEVARRLVASVGSRVDAIAIRGAGITPVTKAETPEKAETPGKTEIIPAEVTAQLAKGKVPDGWTSEGQTLTDTTGKKWNYSVKDDEITLTSGTESKTVQKEITPLIKFSRSPEGKVYFDTLERAREQSTQEFPKPVADGFYHVDRNAGARDIRRDELAVREGIHPEAVASGRWALDTSDSLLKSRDQTIALAKALGVGHTKSESTKKILEKITALAVSNFKGPKKFGSTNTGKTREDVEKAFKNVSRKVNSQTNIGGMLDPSILKDAITIGAFYLEGGARSFKDFSAKMIEDFGAGVQKYIRPAYEALRKRTDIDTSGMDPEEGGEPAAKVEEPKTPPPPAPKAEAPKAAPTQEAPKPAPAAASFPTEINLVEQPERPETKVVPPDEKPVGFSNAEMDAEAERIVGRELVRPVQEAISDEALWAQATAEFKRDFDAGRRLVANVLASRRVVGSKEQAMLGMELVRRKNRLNDAATKFLASPEGDVAAKDDYEIAQRDYDDALYANSIAGGDLGRALRFRRLMANLDMSLESMLSTLKAVGNKAELSKEQVAAVTKLSEESAKLREEIDALRKKAETSDTAPNAEYLETVRKAAFEEGRKAVLDEQAEQAKADAENIAEMQKRRADVQAAKKEAAKKPSVIDELIKAAEARKAARRGKLYSDVLMLNAAADAADTVFIGALKIAKGITKFADWAISMKESDPEIPDGQMEQLFKQSQAMHDGEELPAAEAPLKTKKAKAPVIERVQSIAADGEQLDSRTVYNLVVEKMKARVEANPALKTVEMSEDDLTSIIEEVTADVKQYFPDITEREIRDTFSGYGVILKPSQDDLAKQMRQLTALGRLQSAIDDAVKGLPSLKSGVQRDRATQAIRLQQKKLNRELRMMGHTYEASEGQLRSPLDAMKARVNNQINDLDYEIRKGRKNRRPTPDADPELEKLIELRDDLKRISDVINAPAGPTFSELVQDEKDKLDKRIGVLEKALENPQPLSKPDRQLYTQELQVKRDKRDALNEQIRKLRKIEADKSRTQEDIDKAAVESVRDSIKELQRKINEKDFARPERRTPTETAEYLALVAQKEALQDQIKADRLELFGRKGMSDEQRIKLATAAIDKSAARIQEMLTSGNYEVPKRVSKTPETPELKKKRDARDALRKQLIKLRKLKREASVDPIAKQIATDKKRIQTRMDKLKKRMAAGDFSKPVKREKATDQGLLDLLAEEEKLKDKWGEMLLNHKLSQRSKAKRYWDNIFDTLSFGRFLKASTDLSAIANQGNFALFSHPVLSMRQLGGMWQAMKSDKNQKLLEAKIRELPEYKSGEMKRAGLYLAMDAGPNDPLQKQEEAMANRWVNKIPKRYGGGVLRATSRAYTTYLDLIRVATYLSLKNNLVEGGWFMQPQEPTTERLKSITSLINNGTGRGSLGSGKFGAGMAQAAPFLNTFMFAPRFGVSRFAMALGFPLWTASKGTKRLIAIEYAKYLAGLSTAMLLYSMFQDEDDKEMEFDPTSSDFGKVIFDNNRVDVMGGFQQPLVFLLRLLFGEYKNSQGKIKPLREGDRPLNLFRETPLTDKPKFTDRSGAVVVGDFLRYKLSPTASLLVNAAAGKTPIGERTDLASEMLTMPIPLIFGQLAETAKSQQEDPLMALLLAGSGIAGVRTSNQDPNVDRSKSKTAWEQLIEFTKYYSGIQ